MTRTLVAVDLGAQSGRVAVGRFDGERLHVEEVHRFPTVAVREQGRLRWDVRRLYADVLDGLRAAARAAGPVDAVGVDSWAIDFGLLDRSGELLANPVHYRDERRAAAMPAALEAVPARELYGRTGIQLLPINTVFELAALAADGDPTLAAAETLLLIPDLVHFWLCGVRACERTNASTTQCWDPFAGAWAVDLLARLDVRSEILPDVVPPATPLAPLAEEVGLGRPTVVAGATHDTAAAVAAVPFRRPDSAYVSAGTWSLVGIEAQQPAVDDATFAANVTNESGLAGTVRVLKNVTGLWLLEESRRAWARDGHDATVDELVAEAASAPALRSLVDPDDSRFAGANDAAGPLPDRVREACAETGQPVPEEPSEVVRCLLESLALKHGATLDVLAAATGSAPTEVHVVGGGARNALLCRWTAEAAGRPVLCGPAEATLAGNLLAQALALGELGSLDEGREVVRRSFAPAVHEPTGAPEWSEARARFAELFAPQGVAA